MEEQQSKVPRKRVANFTANEKALLTNLIKKMPIVESKLTDGKSVAKKQAAWELVTKEFNCNANVSKRETLTLKRAWDNMKAYTRKARATERGSLTKTGGGPPELSPTPQHTTEINMVEEDEPVMIYEIKNSFDSEGTIKEINNSHELELKTNSNENPRPVSFETIDQSINKKYSPIKIKEQVRRPADYIRRESALRIQHLENKKRVEMQILNTQLDVEEIRNKSALLEQERQQVLLEKAKIELKELIKLIRRKEDVILVTNKNMI